MDDRARTHDARAPYWAAALVIFGGAGVLTTVVHRPGFWGGYVLDMVGPAWNYILFRGLFTSYRNTAWTRFFSPTRTLVLFVAFCFVVEAAQYLELYDSTFDPLDLLAYVSLLTPCYVIDRWLPDSAS
jgi:hypothetical protein